jgi:amidophosphoribosyltransferase
MIKGRYGTLNGTVRGFIHPDLTERRKVAKENYYPFEIIKGREIVIIDDSIIAGVTTKEVIEALKKYAGLLKNGGAAKIHLRIVFPPVIGSCPFGVDIDDKRFLVAREFNKNLKAIAGYIGADSLAYLTPEQYAGAVQETMGKEIGLCLGCTTGKYPVSKFKADKLVFESEIE